MAHRSFATRAAYLALAACSCFAFEHHTASAAEAVPSVVVSVQHPPLGFIEELETLGNGQIEFSQKHETWTSFFAADVWIFFVAGKSELKQLPDGVLQAIRSPAAKTLRESTRLEALTNLKIELNGERDVDIQIFNMSQFRENSPFERACLTASMTFSQLINADTAASQKRVAQCAAN
ncbi:hypothetical protein [uncultured Sulfitobacter sp.]|uniref:hypothetical protein n=1 Tax=uncultured Sulfitobacter sp. TaxID=191468 RepID=UPI0026108FBE|nr:hypothetical protein [uncultured Sulfitobacter sp.]